MSEGSHWPKTWNEAVPLIVWGVLVFASGFEGVVHAIPAIATGAAGEWIQSAISFVLMAGLTAMLLHWNKFHSLNPNLLVPAAIVVLLAVIFSPYVAQNINLGWVSALVVVGIVNLMLLLLIIYIIAVRPPTYLSGTPAGIVDNIEASVATTALPSDTEFSSLANNDLKKIMSSIVTKLREVAERHDRNIRSLTVAPNWADLSEEERRLGRNIKNQERGQAINTANQEVWPMISELISLHYEILIRLKRPWPNDLSQGVDLTLRTASPPNMQSCLEVCSYLERLVGELS